MKAFPAGVAEQIGWYVYLYIDPRNDEVFYVGKGVKDRVFDHLNERSESKKVQRIDAIRKDGKEPRLEILRHNLPDEKTALLIESTVIDLIGIPPLTNLVKGRGSEIFGRMTIDQTIVNYAAEEVVINEKALLIRVNQKFYHGISSLELYEITRGVWKVGSRADETELAFAVYQGVVREVYRISEWHRAGSTNYQTRDDVEAEGKWEFSGDVAEESLREKYLLKSVKNYFGANVQSSFIYVNC